MQAPANPPNAAGRAAMAATASDESSVSHMVRTTMPDVGNSMEADGANRRRYSGPLWWGYASVRSP